MTTTTTRARLAAAAVLITITIALAGCATTTSQAGTQGSATATASPSPVPIEEVVELDPLAEPLVAAGRELVAGSDGFAALETRTALDLAVQHLETSVQVAQLSAAGGPAASQADPPVDEASIAADIDALYAAIGGVRTGVIETASRVLNSETPDAPQVARDGLYTAIVAQQTAATTTATDDSPRQLLELVALTRTVQDAQVAGAAAAAEAAREAAESNDASSGGGGGGGSEGPTFQRFEPVMPPECTRIDATSWSCPHAPGDPWVLPPMVPVG
jgi:hypothetical protein